MTLPRFLGRIADAAGPLLTGLDRSAIGERLENAAVALRIDERTAETPGQAVGYLMAVNLAARLYPRIAIDAPTTLAAHAESLARSINPGVTVDADDPGFQLVWGPGTPGATSVTVAARAWAVEIDGTEAESGPVHGPAAIAAAAWGMGEIFRAVFSGELVSGRTAPEKWVIDMVTMTDDETPYTELPDVDIGRTHLAGCGAIAHAAVAALRELPLTGTLAAVDFEAVDLGNLQRYVLTTDADENVSKLDIVERALAGTRLQVEKIESRWGDDERSGPGSATVLTALDTKRDRIAVQAGLPREIYNGYTQPEDVGVSRHEHFGGDQPCLACICWPRGEAPSESSMIAESLGQHELRVLAYLISNTPVGRPLAAEQVGQSLRLQRRDGSEQWTRRSLLDDLSGAFDLTPQDVAHFSNLPIDRLYRDGVCAGALMRASDRPADEVSVPLAHQSVLAGAVLTATFYVSRVPELAARRPAAEQVRYDVLGGGRQEMPVAWEPHASCLCRDADFRQAYAERWGGSGDAVVEAA